MSALNSHLSTPVDDFLRGHLCMSSLYVLLPAPLEIYIYESYSGLERFQNSYRQILQVNRNLQESNVSMMEAAINEMIHKLETNLKQMDEFL